jgi:hypothetical protein
MGDGPRGDPERLPSAARRLQQIRRTTAARARPLAVLASAALLLLALQIRAKEQERPTSAHLSDVYRSETGPAAQDALRSAASASTGGSKPRANRLHSGVSAAQTDQQGRGAVALLANQDITSHAASAAQLGLLSAHISGAKGLPQQDTLRIEPHRTLVGTKTAGEGGIATVVGGAGAAAVGSGAAGAAAADSGGRPAAFLFAGVLSGRGYRHRRLAVREAWADSAQARRSALELDVERLGCLGSALYARRGIALHNV